MVSLAAACSLCYSSAAHASQVPVYTWQNIQSVVNSYPGGTTFVIEPGVHRMQSVVPKSYDTFIGKGGSILSGAKLLTSFHESGSYWVTDAGSISQKYPDSSKCQSGHAACTLPEDLFFDNHPLTRVTSLSQVGPGRWYLDYSTGNVYMANNPSGHQVELSLVRWAFSGSASHVTIDYLTIEKYASPTDAGAVNSQYGYGQHWTVEWSDIRYNHGVGVRIGNYMWAYHNALYDNGQMGIGGTGDNVVVQSNKIYNNNVDDYAYAYAGGSKFCRCNNLKVQYNTVTNNNGPGLWTDIDNNYVLYEGNYTSGNKVAGIFHEISYHATIRHNYIVNDGVDPRGSSIWWGAGILINSSPDVQIYGNTVKDCMNGIGAIQADRGSGAYGPHLVKNLNVYSNTIDQVHNSAAGIVKASDFDNSVYTSWNNHIQSSNVFNLAYAGARYFFWLDEYWTLSQWDNYVSIH